MAKNLPNCRMCGTQHEPNGSTPEGAGITLHYECPKCHTEESWFWAKGREVKYQ